MRNLRRQVQHGPTCRSIVILVLGIFVLSVSTRPRVLHSTLRLGRLTVDDDLRHMRGDLPISRARISSVGGGVSSGLSQQKPMPVKEAARATQGGGSGAPLAKAIHVALTSNGSPYMNWQSRIMYYTYLKVASLPGSDMKFFSRILHRATPDALMDVMPTYRVDPLDPRCDTWCEYPVASRPAAINSWLQSDDVKAEWIFMIETDYVFVKPVSIPTSGRPLGFPYGYVDPNYPSARPCTIKYSKGVPPEKVQGTGNAPTLIRVEQLRQLLPYWIEATALIEKDAMCKEAFGWVREMYSFSIAAAVNGIQIDLPPMPHAIMSQPPADTVVGDAAILHYTWGSFFKRMVNGKEETYWKFEKREFTKRGLPDRFPPLPDSATDGQRALMGAINEAIENLPRYTRGELREEGMSEADIKKFYNAYDARMAAKNGKSAATTAASSQQNAEPRREAKSRAELDAGIQANSIHTILTSNGNPYMNWQTQIMYYTYQQVAGREDSQLKFFTRILHRTKDDDLSASIPTFRANPLHPECDDWCDYPVADRADAVLQWMNSGDMRGDWIFMIESDYLFVKPVPIPASGRALGFPFGYIIPTWPTITHIMKRYYPGDLKDIPQTGNAPMLAKTEDMWRVVPHWMDITARFEKDAEAKKELGWVREMYAFSIAAALGNMPVDLPPVPNAIMVQPPADSELGDAAIIHYTWGMEFKDGDKILWRFDKRDYTAPGQHPPMIKELPAGMGSELQKLFVTRMNEAIQYEFYEKLHRRLRRRQR